MPNCFPQPRLSLCGSEETQRLRFEDHAGVFSAILRKARCHPLIEVLDIDAAVVGCPDSLRWIRLALSYYAGDLSSFAAVFRQRCRGLRHCCSSATRRARSPSSLTLIS